MICGTPKPIFPNQFFIGIKKAEPYPDGYSVYLQWAQALPSLSSNEVGYNVYFSTNKNTVLTEGPKYFTRYSELKISRFSPGIIVYILVRACEYTPTIQNPLNFVVSSQAPNAYSYPETALISNIDSETLNIPLIDVSEFPNYGILKIGYELIKYNNVDYNNNIVYATSDGRGYYNTTVSIHNVDGYDGYDYLDPVVRYYEGWEDTNLIYTQFQPRFEVPNYPFTEADGYRTKDKDILNTDLSASNEAMIDFPSYDNSGYHRTSIVDYFSGYCVGSYHGGEIGCGDNKYRTGINIQDRSAQRLEEMLQVTGEPVILLRRKWTGITCQCYRLNNEHADARCPFCLGTSFVGGYDQYYNTRRADSKILMRFPATVDDLAQKEHGLQQNFVVNNAWTLVVPAIHDRDCIIRFNEDKTREFMYECINVTRNKLFFGLSGAQAMSLYRVDKTDIMYQFRTILDTSLYKSTLNTTMGVLRGHGPHYHTIVVTEKNNTLAQINSTTSTVMGHCHSVISGKILDMGLGHSHTIIL